MNKRKSVSKEKIAHIEQGKANATNESHKESNFQLAFIQWKGSECLHPSSEEKLYVNIHSSAMYAVWGPQLGEGLDIVENGCNINSSLSVLQTNISSIGHSVYSV